jgi:hypothetical protein
VIVGVGVGVGVCVGVGVGKAVATNTQVVLTTKSPYESVIVTGYSPTPKFVIAGAIFPFSQAIVYGGVPPVIPIETAPSKVVTFVGSLVKHFAPIGNIVITSHSFLGAIFGFGLSDDPTLFLIINTIIYCFQ